MKVSEARSEFQIRKKDIADIDFLAGTFLKWCNYVNRYAYRLLTNIRPENYIKTQVYTTSVGTESYALPTDFQDIIPQGTGLYLISAAGVNTDFRTATTNFGSTKNGFYMTSANLVFTPKPTDVKSYNFRYIPLLTDLAVESDSFIIPDRFSEYIMNALDRCYNIWDNDNGEEAWNDERFINTMNELVALIKPDAEVVILPDFTSDFYD
jgi:hypothetical protein